MSKNTHKLHSFIATSSMQMTLELISIFCSGIIHSFVCSFCKRDINWILETIKIYTDKKVQTW